MVVEQDEMVADREFQPLFDDESVLDGTRNRPHVHDFVHAGGSFCGGVHFLIGLKFMLALHFSGLAQRVFFHSCFYDAVCNRAAP